MRSSLLGRTSKATSGHQIHRNVRLLSSVMACRVWYLLLSSFRSWKSSSRVNCRPVQRGVRGWSEMIKQGHQTHNRINEQCREVSSTTMLNDISSAWLTPTLPRQTTRRPDPIWIYHYWQLESINPLIYPIRLSPSGNRSRRCFFIVFVWLSACGRRGASVAGWETTCVTDMREEGTDSACPNNRKTREGLLSLIRTYWLTSHLLTDSLWKRSLW